MMYIIILITRHYNETMADFASKYAFAFEDSSDSDEDGIILPQKKGPSPVK